MYSNSLSVHVKSVFESADPSPGNEIDVAISNAMANVVVILRPISTWESHEKGIELYRCMYFNPINV